MSNKFDHLNVDRYETTYRSKWSGKQEVHVNKNNESDARGWGKVLAENNGCKTVTEAVDRNGNRRHITSEGHD